MSQTTGRVAQLVAAMTTDEKIAQLVGIWVQVDDDGQVAPYQGQFMQADGRGHIEQHTAHGLGQLTRPFGSRPVHPRDGMASIEALQRSAVTQTRLGVPLMVHEECLTGFMALGATAFPCPLNWGSSWDPDLVREVGDAIRESMRAVGAHQGLAPVLDVVRDARWGRVEECIAEDPYLVGMIGCGYIQGLQGTSLREGVIATAKHFAGYSFSEGGRNIAPTHVGPREFEDVFLLPFEMAVKIAGVRSVMNAYQDNDGMPAAADRGLLTDVLRDRWGFDGIVVSDYFSVAMLEGRHGVATDKADAARQALHAGIDVELPDPDCYPHLEPGEDLDRAVGRVLKVKEDLGLLDEPFAPPADVDLDPPAHRALARRVAEKSIVLLRNRDGVLPLDTAAARRIAVVGPNASSRSALLGNYTFPVHLGGRHPEALDAIVRGTVASALAERLPAARLIVVEGCRVLDDDTSGFADAVTAASDADVAVVVVGDQAGNFGTGTSGEGTDTDDLRLPGVQDQFVRAIAETGTPTVVVLVSGRPYVIDWIAEHASAVVAAWLPGEEGAAAIADVLTGAINPSGKTSVSFGRGAGQQPRPYNQKLLGKSGYARSRTTAVFPFGHGLSYTTFEYGDLTLAADEVPSDGTIDLSFTITNTGDRAGDDVAQVYVRDLVASVTRPVLELKAFGRASLDAGVSTTASFSIPVDMLSFIGRDLRRVIEPGEHLVRIGASSADIRLEATVGIVGEPRYPGEDRALLSSMRFA